MKKLILVGIITTLFGCATDAPIYIMRTQPENLKVISNEDLCRTYGLMWKGKREQSNIAKEILDRKMFTDEQWKDVNHRTVWIGMPEDGIQCALGTPNKVNTSTGSWGVHKQWVYNGFYVYTKNGKVTSWQD